MAGWQRGQTHCKHGHAFTSDNTKVRKDGVRICLTCVSVRSAKCYANQPQERKEKKMRRSVLQRYGLTLFEYEEMSRKQRHLCAICEQPEKTKRGRLHVDHDHLTGKNRQLLCSRCNLALGGFCDDPYLLLRAADYVKTHKEPA